MNQKIRQPLQSSEHDRQEETLESQKYKIIKKNNRATSIAAAELVNVLSFLFIRNWISDEEISS